MLYHTILYPDQIPWNTYNDEGIPINLTERRSFYRKMNDTKLTNDNKYNLQKLITIYTNKSINYKIEIYT